MGTWGHRVFDDDHAVEVREEYLALLLAGRSSQEATDALLGDGALDLDEEPTFWLGLAATQREYGRLVPRVKEEALRIIDTGIDLRRGPGNEKKRAAELAKLRAQLLAPQPKPKKVVSRKPRLAPGDFFRLPLGDGYAFGRVLTETERAFYLLKAPGKDVPLDEVASAEVAFVVGCTDDGFSRRRWRVIGNRPLEPRLTKPTWFFHRAVGSPTCDAFDIWHPEVTETRPAAACQDLERWGSWSEVHVVERLRAALEGAPSVFLDTMRRDPP
jgi:hypothetical protein